MATQRELAAWLPSGMEAAAPQPAALTGPQRDSLLQWLTARGQQSKATSLRRLARRVQTMTHCSSHLEAVRIARQFMLDTGVRLELTPRGPRMQNFDECGTDVE